MPESSVSEAFLPLTLIDRPLPVEQRKFTFVSRSGVCLNLDGPDRASFPPDYPGLRRDLTWVSLGQAVKRGIQFSGDPAPHMLFHGPWSDGYYHWLIEAVPRLLSLREHWGRHRLIIPGTVPSPWFSDWLREISGGNHIELKRGGLFVRQVVFQQCGQRTDRLSPHAVRSLADYFKTRFGYDDRPSGPRKLYISRARAGFRKVVNEPELLDRLTERGFVSLILEEMNFPDQVRAFAAADIVVSVHGAGLANSVFMESGTRLIELTQPPHPDRTQWRRIKSDYLLMPCFRGLAQIRDVQHDAFFCEPRFEGITAEVLKQKGPLSANLQVDVTSLCRKLDGILG